MDINLREKWLQICLIDHPWITDNHEPTIYGEPAMTPESFREFETPTEMALEMIRLSWNAGEAFVYKDQCWISQTLGGNEMLVIKQDKSFESMSVELIAGMGYKFNPDGNYHEYNPVALRCLVDNIIAIDRATVEECVSLDYDKYLMFDRNGNLKKSGE